MSRETALVQRTRPYLLMQRAAELFSGEAAKGCDHTVVRESVSLEPAYRSVREFTARTGVQDEVPVSAE